MLQLLATIADHTDRASWLVYLTHGLIGIQGVSAALCGAPDTSQPDRVWHEDSIGRSMSIGLNLAALSPVALATDDASYTTYKRIAAGLVSTWIIGLLLLLVWLQTHRQEAGGARSFQTSTIFSRLAVLAFLFSTIGVMPITQILMLSFRCETDASVGDRIRAPAAAGQVPGDFCWSSWHIAECVWHGVLTVFVIGHSIVVNLTVVRLEVERSDGDASPRVDGRIDAATALGMGVVGVIWAIFGHAIPIWAMGTTMFVYAGTMLCLLFRWLPYYTKRANAARGILASAGVWGGIYECVIGLVVMESSSNVGATGFYLWAITTTLAMGIAYPTVKQQHEKHTRCVTVKPPPRRRPTDTHQAAQRLLAVQEAIETGLKQPPDDGMQSATSEVLARRRSASSAGLDAIEHRIPPGWVKARCDWQRRAWIHRFITYNTYLEARALRHALKLNPAWDHRVNITLRLQAMESDQRALSDVDAATTPVGRHAFKEYMREARAGVERCLELQVQLWECTLDKVVDLTRLQRVHEAFQLAVYEADAMMTRCLRISSRVPELLRLMSWFQQTCVHDRGQAADLLAEADAQSDAMIRAARRIWSTTEALSWCERDHNSGMSPATSLDSSCTGVVHVALLLAPDAPQPTMHVTAVDPRAAAMFGVHPLDETSRRESWRRPNTLFPDVVCEDLLQTVLSAVAGLRQGGFVYIPYRPCMGVGSGGHLLPCLVTISETVPTTLEHRFILTITPAPQVDNIEYALVSTFTDASNSEETAPQLEFSTAGLSEYQPKTISAACMGVMQPGRRRSYVCRPASRSIDELSAPGFNDKDLRTGESYIVASLAQLELKRSISGRRLLRAQSPTGVPRLLSLLSTDGQRNINVSGCAIPVGSTSTGDSCDEIQLGQPLLVGLNSRQRVGYWVRLRLHGSNAGMWQPSASISPQALQHGPTHNPTRAARASHHLLERATVAGSMASSNGTGRAISRLRKHLRDSKNWPVIPELRFMWWVMSVGVWLVTMGFSLFMVMQTVAVVQAHTADLSDISTSGARALVVHELNAVLGNLILMRHGVFSSPYLTQRALQERLPKLQHRFSHWHNSLLNNSVSHRSSTGQPVRMTSYSDTVQGVLMPPELVKVPGFGYAAPGSVPSSSTHSNTIDGRLMKRRMLFGYYVNGMPFNEYHDSGFAGHLLTAWIQQLVLGLPELNRKDLTSRPCTQSWRELLLGTWRLLDVSDPQSDFARAMHDEMTASYQRLQTSADDVQSLMSWMALGMPASVMLIVIPLTIAYMLRVHSLVVEPLRILIATPITWRKLMHADAYTRVEHARDIDTDLTLLGSNLPVSTNADDISAAGPLGMAKTYRRKSSGASRHGRSGTMRKLDGKSRLAPVTKESHTRGTAMVIKPLARRLAVSVAALLIFNGVFYSVTQGFIRRSVDTSSLLMDLGGAVVSHRLAATMTVERLANPIVDPALADLIIYHTDRLSTLTRRISSHLYAGTEQRDFVVQILTSNPCQIAAQYYDQQSTLIQDLAGFNATLCEEYDNGMIKGGVLSAFYDFDRQIRGALTRRLSIDNETGIEARLAYNLVDELNAAPATAMLASDLVLAPVIYALAGLIEKQSQSDTEVHVNLCLWAFVVYCAIAFVLLVFVDYPLFRSVRSTIYFARCSLLVLDEAVIDALPEVKWLVKHSGRVLQDARHSSERLSLWRRLCQFRSPRVGLCALEYAR